MFTINPRNFYSKVQIRDSLEGNVKILTRQNHQQGDIDLGVATECIYIHQGILDRTQSCSKPHTVTDFILFRMENQSLPPMKRIHSRATRTTLSQLKSVNWWYMSHSFPDSEVSPSNVSHRLNGANITTNQIYGTNKWKNTWMKLNCFAPIFLKNTSTTALAYTQPICWAWQATDSKCVEGRTHNPILEPDK